MSADNLQKWKMQITKKKLLINGTAFSVSLMYEFQWTDGKNFKWCKCFGPNSFCSAYYLRLWTMDEERVIRFIFRQFYESGHRSHLKYTNPLLIYMIWNGSTIRHKLNSLSSVFGDVTMIHVEGNWHEHYPNDLINGVKWA